jgi:type II/III secretion system protein
MKRLIIAIALLLAAVPSFAQEAKDKEPEYNTTREFRTRVFQVQNRSAEDIASAVRLLGSGFKGSGLSINRELRTITIRDFPENVATVEEAIKRLDVPAAATTDALMRIWIVIGSKSPIANAQPLPEDLEPVIKELRSTLSYPHYALMAATVNRVARGVGVENSGIAEATALGLTAHEEKPVVYSYRMLQPSIRTSVDRQALTTENFRFSMRYPIDTGKGIQYQDVGFEAPVSVRDKEKVVLGTTTMGEKALIVVVTADFTK